MERVAVVTGASSGIGLFTARTLLRQGVRVYGLSRGLPPEEKIRHIPTDVSDEASVRAAFEKIRQEVGRLDILVNNAGFGISGPAELAALSEAKRQFDVNLFGMVACVEYALPLLRESRGRIVNLSSVAAVFSIPFQGFYSASKAAVNSLTLAYRNELKRFGVSVCAVMPGDVNTGFTGARVKAEDPENLYGGADARSIAVMEKDEQNGMTPEYLGRFVAKVALKKRVRPLYTAGPLYRLLCLLGKILPQSLITPIVGKLYMRK